MIRAICFDFDGTLAHFSGDFGAFMDGFRTDLMLTQCDLNAFAEVSSRESRREGHVTLRRATVATLEALEQRSPPDLGRLVERALDEYSSQMVLLPGAREVLTFCTAH